MKKYYRALVVGAGAVIALGMVAACSSGSQEVASSTSVTTSTVAPMPSSATFIADMPEEDGGTMTMAIAVDGDKVVAYTTNGTNDEAYFLGTQKDGHMDVMSMYGDKLKASFDGKNVSGEVTMNKTDATPVKFTASSVAAPAGLYTAAHDNSRATWVGPPRPHHDRCDGQQRAG